MGAGAAAGVCDGPLPKEREQVQDETVREWMTDAPGAGTDMPPYDPCAAQPAVRPRGELPPIPVELEATHGDGDDD